MPVIVPRDLPAINILKKENIYLNKYYKNNSNKLKILILNLMPKKINTENQILRLLSYSPMTLKVDFLKVKSYITRNTPIEHINKFYFSFEKIYQNKYDGLIITGAPLGLIDFKDVFYWEELKNIILWSESNVISTLFICWAAQAALNILYNFPKITRKKKISGVYKHKKLNSDNVITRGFDDVFFVPHSRYTDFPSDLILNYSDINLLVDSKEIGAYLFASKDNKKVFLTGHPEYDSNTLSQEYYRDIKRGLNPSIPLNYFFEKKKSSMKNKWRGHGHLLFFNWLYYCIFLKK